MQQYNKNFSYDKDWRKRVRVTVGSGDGFLL